MTYNFENVDWLEIEENSGKSVVCCKKFIERVREIRPIH